MFAKMNAQKARFPGNNTASNTIDEVQKVYIKIKFIELIKLNSQFRFFRSQA